MNGGGDLKEQILLHLFIRSAVGEEQKVEKHLACNGFLIMECELVVMELIEVSYLIKTEDGLFLYINPDMVDEIKEKMPRIKEVADNDLVINNFTDLFKISLE